MAIEKIFDERIEAKEIDYSYPYNATRYFMKNDDEEDVTLEAWRPSNMVNADIENPRNNIVIMKMIVEKYRDRLGNLLDISAKDWGMLKRDFGSRENISIDDIVLFGDNSTDSSTMYFALTKDLILGVDKETLHYEIPLDKFKLSRNSFKNKYSMDARSCSINIIEAILEVITELRHLTTKVKKASAHFLMSKDIHFREDYIAILYSMLLSDECIYASEINALYSIAKSLDIKNDNFLKIVNAHYPFDSNKAVALVRKYNKSLFQGTNKFVLVKDLITIIYSDEKKVRSEELLLTKICSLLGIEDDMVNNICELADVKINYSDKSEIENKEQQLAEYLMINHINDKIKNILLQGNNKDV